MDVVRLGPRYSTVYKPDELIEGYSSMIWTERHAEPGNFELRTPYITKTLALLPEDTLISHLETDAVAIVETHSIDEGENGNYELKVTGRTVDSFLENRFLEGVYQKKRKLGRVYSPASAAAMLLWNAIANGTGKDVSHTTDKPWPTLDVLPNIAVTDSSPVNAATKRWWVTEGDLYPQLNEILDAGDLGLRTIRPNAGSSASVISVAALPLSSRGTVSRTYTTGINQLRFDIYKGLDRSASQTVNTKVEFNYLHGHISKANYLFSHVGFKTVLEMMSAVAVGDVYRNATEQAYSGWKRRVLGYDAGTPEDGETVAEFKEDALADAVRVLKSDNRKVRLFSGDISPHAPYQYREHYNLGDTVTLYGDYDLVETMIVSEYVRTEDREGDRGLPGLMTP
jgi:hypothetical protein